MQICVSRTPQSALVSPVRDTIASKSHNLRAPLINRSAPSAKPLLLLRSSQCRPRRLRRHAHFAPLRAPHRVPSSLCAPLVIRTTSQRALRSVHITSAAQIDGTKAADVAGADAAQVYVTEKTDSDAHAPTPAASAWQAFSAAFSGEWAGYSVDFSRFGHPLELPQSVVPEAFRDWGLAQLAWQAQTSSAARGESLGRGDARVQSSLVRYAPAAGCEAASPPKYSVERTALELAAGGADGDSRSSSAGSTGAADTAAADDVFAFTADGSYLLVRAGQPSSMPAPASVDAMRVTQWVPRGSDAEGREATEGDSNEGISSVAGGPFQVEHCLAMEGVEAASGRGRVRVRVVQQFLPARGAGVPRIASLALHREKWVEPFSGGAELADGAALFSSEMIEEGEGSEVVREGRLKGIEGRWEVTAREAQLPTAQPAISPSVLAVELAGSTLKELSRQMEASAAEDGTLMLLPEGVWSHVQPSEEGSFSAEVGWLFSSSQG
ncbi:hypothetical protein CLOP_g16996 [Closterium sp. NIES-67]|nr:hypothetical protein CLOP_g21988 [Closterium sp. NIES-67]GJP87031.1 hypothetical protein CLOP_g16996 [Closterium sp. NIES-67]